MLRAQSPETSIRHTLPFVILFLSLTPALAQDAGQYRECSAYEREAYLQSLRSKLVSNWRVPTQFRSVTCTVIIAQNFRGEVLDAGVEDCSSQDARLVKSIEDATCRSSPLPMPENRACFERKVSVRLVRKPDWNAGLYGISNQDFLDEKAAVTEANHAH